MGITTKLCNIFVEWGFDERCVVLNLYKEMSLDKTCAQEILLSFLDIWLRQGT